MEKKYSSDCYNSGLFTILTIILNENASGFDEFKRQAIESWKNLGIDEEITKEAILKKTNKAELVDSLTNEFPKLIGKSYGDKGKSVYELGFWSGMLFLSVMGNEKQSMNKSIDMLRYKCAEVGNPQVILNSIKDFEKTLSNNEKIDIMKVLDFTKENHFWAIGNFDVEKDKNILEVIFGELLPEIPYIGKAVKKVFEYKK